jgi:hypothetical protein
MCAFVVGIWCGCIVYRCCPNSQASREVIPGLFAAGEVTGGVSALVNSGVSCAFPSVFRCRVCIAICVCGFVVVCTPCICLLRVGGD